LDRRFLHHAHGAQSRSVAAHAEANMTACRPPDVIKGGTPQNLVGIAAMTLSCGEYAIHETNQPGSIGGFVSYGCIRMHNRDVLDLYERVHS
jgi:lipoprotein-anchoring transpeptidase ErfK/SrfK